MNKTLAEIIAPAEGQTESWCHLAPFGQYAYEKPQPDGSRVDCVQNLDSVSFTSILNSFGGEVLLDREHRSLTTDDSTAMGWITKLEVRGDGSATTDGLWALVRWTDVGLTNICNRRLRWLSPVWPEITNKDNRPSMLESAALTNCARFKRNLTPVVNRSTPDQPQKKGTAMQELATLFGLPEDASDEEIIAAVKQYVADNEAQAATAEAEVVAEANSEKIANKAAFVEAYIANKEVALATLNSVKGLKDVGVVINRAEARAPSFLSGAGTKVLNRAEFNANLSNLPPAKRQAYYDDNITNVVD